MRIAELSAHEKGVKKVLRKTNGFKCINVVLIKFNSKEVHLVNVSILLWDKLALPKTTVEM